MTLVEVAELSQTLGAVAVAASLIFVGLGIRQNTKATRAASHHAVSEALNQINLLWAASGEATRIWLAGTENRQALSPTDRWRFDSTLRAYFHVCETMYAQASIGAGDQGIVVAERNGIRTAFAARGVREWWLENPYGFSPEFRAYVDGLARS